MKSKRALIFIDGSNFYFKLRDLGLHNLLTFDFSAFARSLIGSDTLATVTYYIGAVRTDGTAKTQELFNNQRRLFAHLKKHQVQYSLGYLLKSDGAFHEKGVDVNIAVDLLVAAYEDLGDTLFLVSSHTDLLPAIKKAQDKGKQVVYIGVFPQVKPRPGGKLPGDSDSDPGFAAAVCDTGNQKSSVVPLL